MEDCERCGLLRILTAANAECAIEIGTGSGGSLSAIAQMCREVYTLDLDPNCRSRVGVPYKNVEYILGNTRCTLHPLLQKLQSENTALGFVLIDGDHSAKGVRSDIEDLLTYRPVCPLWIAMHDSFNPECRRGITSADWESSPYFRALQIDFVPGILHSEPLTNQMWGAWQWPSFSPTSG